MYIVLKNSLALMQFNLQHLNALSMHEVRTIKNRSLVLKSKKSIVAYSIIHRNEDFRFRFRTTSSSTLRIYDKIAGLLYMYEDDNAPACKLSHASCLKSLTVI